MTAMNLKNHYQRSNPFLHNTWIAGVNAFQNSVMGAALSAQKHHGSFSDDDDDAPPQKRRRLGSPDSVDIDQLLASPKIRNGDLKIDVFRIMHKDSKKVRTSQQNPVAPRDVLTTKGTCRITISDVSCEWPHVLHCQSQVCDIKTYKNPFGPHRLVRIDLPRPFYVPRESIFVNRLDDDSHDLSDAYKLTIDLEGTNGASWPPLNSQDFGLSVAGPLAGSSTRRWVMSSEFDRVFGSRVKSPVHLAAGYQPRQQSRPTDYVMDVELRWNTGIKTKTPDKNLKACITAVDPDAEPYTNGHFEPLLDEVNGINGNGNTPQEESAQDPEEELEGDQTPSRSLRTREKNKIYNLKVLSDQAQGKERKRRGRPAQITSTEGKVMYYVPKDQPLCLDYFRCISCGQVHQSVVQLQLHLQTVHLDWDYALEQTSQVPQFRLTRLPESNAAPPQPYQLGRPQKPFVISSFVAGDASWITSRLGPDNADEPPRSPSRKPTHPKHVADRPASQGLPAAQRRGGATKKQKIMVPTTSQPLFDPVSKRRLQPGEEVPKPTPETAWLLHKHREFLNDYGDMTESEQEFIKKWDRFILQQNLTCSAYFPRAWIAFVRQEAPWLVASNHRMVEYAKHVSVLLARDVLDDKIVQEAMSLIAEARKSVKEVANGDGGMTTQGGTLKQSPRASLIRRGANGCQVCQLPVMGPRMLCCSNKSCEHRLYHSNCIKDAALMPVTQSNWLCNSCTRMNS